LTAALPWIPRAKPASPCRPPLRAGRPSDEFLIWRAERVRALRQARRSGLTPGVRPCYTLEESGFPDLRIRFVPPPARKLFHQTVLASGPAAFPLLAPERAGRCPRSAPP